ncbi:hypothetical protein JavanS480_0002 [Streptococcus satellite phage Javan480]|nr:hypothetical protein JavanS453_0018 [Streptococcus satellite phage Javan453]QBX10792.1 hypothetical protein JavanS480_0002 [Streptococcus satellite phage Javan480]
MHKIIFIHFDNAKENQTKKDPASFPRSQGLKKPNIIP